MDSKLGCVLSVFYLRHPTFWEHFACDVSSGGRALKVPPATYQDHIYPPPNVEVLSTGLGVWVWINKGLFQRLTSHTPLLAIKQNLCVVGLCPVARGICSKADQKDGNYLSAEKIGHIRRTICCTTSHKISPVFVSLNTPSVVKGTNILLRFLLSVDQETDISSNRL